MKTSHERPPTSVKTAGGDDDIDLSPALSSWFMLAGEIAKSTGTRLEFITAHSLSMAAALIGHLASKGDGVPISLPLLVISEQAPPAWMQREWLAMERLHDFGNQPPELEHHATRKKNRRLAPLLVAYNYDQPGAFALQESLFAKRIRFGRIAITHGTGRLAAASDNLRMTHLSATLPRVRASWRRLAAGHHDESVIGCVTKVEASKLVREHGNALAGRAGMILTLNPPCPQPGPDIHLPSMTDTLFNMALKARQDQPPYVLCPPPSVMRGIQSHLELRNAAIERTPEALRPMIPDGNRYIDTVTLLAALCPASEKPEISMLTATILARHADFMCVRSHLDFIRRHFPTDERGMFEGEELAVVRQLGGEPQSVREIQRAMKGISAGTCHQAFDRAVAAGLVEEPSPGRFRMSDQGPQWLEAWIRKKQAPAPTQEPVPDPVPQSEPVPVKRRLPQTGPSLETLKKRFALMS